MRIERAIWTAVSCIIGIIVVTVILRFFGLTLKDVTDSLLECIKFLLKLLKMFN